jgi:hypothetical protein
MRSSGCPVGDAGAGSHRRNDRDGDRVAGGHLGRILDDPPGDPARIPVSDADPVHVDGHLEVKLPNNGVIEPGTRVQI